MTQVYKFFSRFFKSPTINLYFLSFHCLQWNIILWNLVIIFLQTFSHNCPFFTNQYGNITRSFLLEDSWLKSNYYNASTYFSDRVLHSSEKEKTDRCLPRKWTKHRRSCRATSGHFICKNIWSLITKIETFQKVQERQTGNSFKMESSWTRIWCSSARDLPSRK